MTDSITTRVKEIAAQLSRRGEKLCTAESCTGGLIAKTLTDLAGSSDWFDRGFVTYSNAAKTDMLSVPESVIETYGAVSEAVVNAMVTGALKHSAADYAIAVTGVAGPGGGSEEKPVGTVWVGIGSKQQVVARKYVFSGDRGEVREATLDTALRSLGNILKVG
ncbi:MAG: nicotinamide-nucleotide amidohydrolase family protein [Gammaproteobacteria bacterium]|nr:nicotinamide-nucleotide amidohydrolase family protein [Gammaproteobacteria bacterium]